ncbi:MAG: hypothetical protein J6S67_24725 [Methanobrevibacter sp.]|nr:hypothetical protein [Methanobrevibacter sp.]
MIKSVNFTKKDEINSVSATPLQKAKGETITLLGAAITKRADENGQEQDVALLSTLEHGMMSGISATAIKSLDLIIDYMEDLGEEAADGIQIRIKAEKSNAGRDFITLEII